MTIYKTSWSKHTVKDSFMLSYTAANIESKQAEMTKLVQYQGVEFNTVEI